MPRGNPPLSSFFWSSCRGGRFSRGIGFIIARSKFPFPALKIGGNVRVSRRKISWNRGFYGFLGLLDVISSNFRRPAVLVQVLVVLENRIQFGNRETHWSLDGKS